MVAADEVVSGLVAMTEADLTEGVTAAFVLFRGRWILVGLPGVVLALAAGTGTVGWSSSIMPAVVSMAAVYLLLFIGPRLIARKLFRALVKAGDSQVFYRFDAEGVTVRASGVTTTFAFRLLSQFRESATTLFLTTNAGATSMVPKRAFSAPDLDRVRALLSAEVKREPKLSKDVKLVTLWIALIFAFVVIWQVLSARPR